jgi:tRNA(Ile)-lysidine synthase
MLEDLFPGWRTNLLSLPGKAKTHRELTQFVVEQMHYQNGSFNRSAFLNLKAALKPVVFKALFEQSVNNQSVSKGLLDDIQVVENLQSGQSVDLTDSYKLIRDRDRYYFHQKSSLLNDLREQLITEHDLDNGVDYKYLNLTVASSPTQFRSENLVLDITKIEFPITLRYWKAGDTIQPFGMKGTQLVSDHLTNRKVPSHKKKEALVMQSFDGMIAAVIFPPETDRVQPGTISEKVRVGKPTKKIIKIEII